MRAVQREAFVATMLPRQAGIRIDHRHSDPSLKRGLLLGYSEVEDSRIHGICGCADEANTSEYRHRDREKMTLKFHKH